MATVLAPGGGVAVLFGVRSVMLNASSNSPGGIAGDADDQDLCRLPGREIERAGWEGAAHEIRLAGPLIGAAGRNRGPRPPFHRRGAGGIAVAGDGEGVLSGAAVALRLYGIGGDDGIPLGDRGRRDDDDAVG